MTTNIEYHFSRLALNELGNKLLEYETHICSNGIYFKFFYSKTPFNNIFKNDNDTNINALIITLFKAIDPSYKDINKEFLNIIIYIEKDYIIRNLELTDDEGLRELQKNVINNKELMKRLLSISESWIDNLEIKLSSVRLKNAFIVSSVNLFVYELSNIIFEEIFPLKQFNFKFDDIQKVKKLESDIKKHIYKSIPSINEMSASVGMSATKFKKIFKEIFGQSVHKYILELKVNHARTLLETNNFSVSQVAYKVGFNHPSGLSRLFKNKYDVTPNEVLSKK